MSGRGRHRGNRSHKGSHAQDREALSLVGDSPVLTSFKNASQKLNDRYDRHERLVTLSREITIESKRIIFLLHSAMSKEQTPRIVYEATDRLNKLVKGPIRKIGLELENSPAYLHSRAVSPGFQEFIEARTLCSWMQNRQLVYWSDVQKEFEHTVKDKIEENEFERTVVTMLPREDYVLGLADLTGELMRKAINSVSSGDSDDCFDSCRTVRDLYTGFLGVFGGGRELARKLNTSRANALKAESAAYALCVRGRLAPAPLLNAPPAHLDAEPDDDEGYY